MTKKDKNIVTFDFDYTCSTKEQVTIDCDVKKFNNLLHCTYKYKIKNPDATTKDLWAFQNTLNNVSTECGFKNGAIYKAKEIISQGDSAFERINAQRKKNKIFQRQKQREICFGGKKLYSDYTKGLISKEEFKNKRMLPIFSVGEKNHKGNRHFEIIDKHTILYKPIQETHIYLHINCSKQRLSTLLLLKELQNNKKISLTWQLDSKKVYVSFDMNKLQKTELYKSINNRLMTIDINPNYIGYTISDWKGELEYKIIKAGVLSCKSLNDYDNSLKGKGFPSDSKEREYVSNKRNFEVCEIAKQLTKMAKYYHCEYFGFEKLIMGSSDKERGKYFNRLCNNQWCRGKLLGQLEKRCKNIGIKIQKINPAFSSFIGNMVYRQENLPDMCLAALEIGRRVYEYTNQYIKKTKEKQKNIIFPEVKLFQKQIAQALEEIGYIVKFDGLRELYYLIKNAKVKYRVLLSLFEQAVFRFSSQKSYINLYSFR